MRKIFLQLSHLAFITILMIFVWSLTGCSTALQSPASTGPAEPASAATLKATSDPSDDPSFIGSQDTISFETLAQGFRVSATQSDLTLHLADSPVGLESLSPLLESEHQSLLKDVDFERNAILAVFWGVKPSGGYSITIDKIWIEDTVLNVSLVLDENDPDLPKVESSTFPYHLVIIDRLSLPMEGDLSYRLVSGDRELLSGKLP